MNQKRYIQPGRKVKRQVDRVKIKIQKTLEVIFIKNV